MLIIEKNTKKTNNVNHQKLEEKIVAIQKVYGHCGYWMSYPLT